MKTFKLTCIALAYLLTSFTTAAAKEERFTGPYLGGQLSYDSFNTSDSEDVLYLSRLNRRYEARAIPGAGLGIFGGYGWRLLNSDFIAFTEASLNAYQTSGETSQPQDIDPIDEVRYMASYHRLEESWPTYINKISVYNAGLSLGLGYRISNVMPYAKANIKHYITKSNITLAMWHHDLYDEESQPAYHSSKRSSKTTFGFSIGLKYAPIESLEIGAEYSWHTLTKPVPYEVTGGKVYNEYDALWISSISTRNVKMRHHSFGVNVAYRF